MFQLVQLSPKSSTWQIFFKDLKIEAPASLQATLEAISLSPSFRQPGEVLSPTKTVLKSWGKPLPTAQGSFPRAAEATAVPRNYRIASGLRRAV